MADDNAHSLLSPSGAKRWATCHGSLALEAGYPRTSSKYAAEGTAAHTLAEWCLTSDVSPDAEAFLGRVIEADGYSFTVDADMAMYVNQYVTDILRFAEGNSLMVEQRLPFGSMIGQPDDIAFGTSDAVILAPGELQVHDLKYGQGVRVDAEENEQLMLYALGAMAEFEILHEFDTVRLVIHQPRLGHLSEWTRTVDELKAFATDMRMHAKWALDLRELSEKGGEVPVDQLAPSEEACRFCKAKAKCPAMAQAVSGAVAKGEPASADDFEDLTAVEVANREDVAALGDERLGQCMAMVGLVEDWCKAIRSEVETRLLEGKPVPGFKLVEGRKGNRKWVDPHQVETLLKSFRLKKEEMYGLSLLSPAAAEKLLKKDAPRRWAKVQELITQSEGGPSVAPADDPRPAIATHATADDFEAIEDASDGSDLV